MNDRAQNLDRQARCVYFDLDGTLTDPALGITRCIQHALQALDEPVLGRDELLWCIGPPLVESFRQLVGDARAEQAVALYRERFADVGLYENELYAGIEQTLSHLQQRAVHLYVASSKPRVYVQQILEHFDLQRFFIQAYGSELDGTRSNKAELLAYALQDSAERGDGAFMIGDRSHDAVGARANGLGFVGVLYGYGDRSELQAAGARHFAEHHSHLPPLLEGVANGHP